jgi:hypothetical protein
VGVSSAADDDEDGDAKPDAAGEEAILFELDRCSGSWTQR